MEAKLLHFIQFRLARPSFIVIELELLFTTHNPPYKGQYREFIDTHLGINDKHTHSHAAPPYIELMTHMECVRLIAHPFRPYPSNSITQCSRAIHFQHCASIVFMLRSTIVLRLDSDREIHSTTCVPPHPYI